MCCVEAAHVGFDPLYSRSIARKLRDDVIEIACRGKFIEKSILVIEQLRWLDRCFHAVSIRPQWSPSPGFCERLSVNEVSRQLFPATTSQFHPGSVRICPALARSARRLRSWRRIVRRRRATAAVSKRAKRRPTGDCDAQSPSPNGVNGPDRAGRGSPDPALTD